MFDFLESMRDWSAARQRWAIAVFVAVVLPIAAWKGWSYGFVLTQPDTDWYFNLAAGRPAMLPFAARQLGPLLVRWFAELFHVSLATGFVVQGTVSLAIFLTVIGFLLVNSRAPRFMLTAIGGLFFWSMQWNALVMPDVLSAALLCGFLLLLRREAFLWAALMMFPMTLSRESTLLTLFCFLLAGWRRLRAAEVTTAVLATVVGTLVVKHLTANALANQEHISPILYLFAKMPWNLLRNVLGIDVWANLYPACGVPKWQMPLHLGPLHAIGSCGFILSSVTQTVSVAMVIFGLLPVLLFRLRHVRVTTGGRADLLLRFSLIYGAISFVLAPMLGESVTRLYGYSWPLFFVALPILLGATGARFTSNGAAWLFMALHLVLVWTIVYVYTGPLVIVAAIFYAAAWLILRRSFTVPAPDESTSSRALELDKMDAGSSTSSP